MSFSAVQSFFQAGGLFMYPILIVMAFGIAITIERVMYLRRANAETRNVWGEMLPLINGGQYQAAEAIAKKSSTAIGRVLGFGLSRSNGAKKRAPVERAMSESMMEIMPQLERRTHYLATFANVATLLGLLGTITGLIHGFASLADVNPAQKQDLLSSAVSEAMNCTAFGLSVAIPFLLVHSWLRSSTDSLIEDVETAAVKFLNSLGLED